MERLSTLALTRITWESVNTVDSGVPPPEILIPQFWVPATLL